jgi:uncharacterized protein YgbK (DUF1537 family)
MNVYKLQFIIQNMIAVIADDFTGAAELAGISLRYGLKVSVCLDKEADPDVDVLIVDTNSRSLKKEEALKVTTDAVRKVVQLNPEFIYKKIDSVLRGYVLDELKIQMQIAGFKKVFILPANPSLGRAIVNGKYFIEGKPVTETGFVSDPEFPIKSSFVNKILKDESVKVLKLSDELPTNGFVVGEATNEDDVKQWADKLDNSWMFVGAGDFYTALLNKKYNQQTQPGFQLQLPHLYVCGTSFKERKKQIKEIEKDMNCVSYLPESINEAWINKTGNILNKKGKAVIAIEETDVPALLLRTTMAETVKDILDKEPIREIFVEGGSTAAAILQELNITKLLPVNELQRGVVRMKAGNLFITVKPGSYPLPEEIKRLYRIDI